MTETSKSQAASRKNIICSVVIGYFAIFAIIGTSYAEEITILYTGETHAMLYPCSCPRESDGGIARRGSLIKELKKKYPEALLLDAGAFFAGGPFDEYTQNTQLDSARTLVNLKAMELMKYDALALGDDEFNFGIEFLLSNIDKTKLKVLSSNIKADKFLPYIIKEVRGIKIGIIGVTSLSAMQKAEGFKFIEPKKAVSDKVEELKKSGVGFIVVLSHLGETEDLALIDVVKGINVLISGHTLNKSEPFSKINETILLRPSWQGRKLGKAVFNLEGNNVKDFKVELLRLSDKIKDDKEMLSLLPACFSDSDCKKAGSQGACQNPGSLNASCNFTQANRINLTVLTTKDCITCDTESMVSVLNKQLPGLVTSYLYYPESKEAQKMIKDFALSGLPAYILGKEIEKENVFDTLKNNLVLKGNFYIMKPEFGGLNYFLKRKKIKGKLDLLISLYDKNMPELLDAIKEFSPDLHFLALEKEGKFDTAKGNQEVEEYLRSVCVQQYYPEYFWEYVTCRAENINSTWWEDCLGGLDTGKIRACAKGSEGVGLLKENISLDKELQVMFGPTYLLDNIEIFSTKGLASKEELRKIIKR